MKPVVDGLAQEYADQLDFVIYANLRSTPEIAEFSGSKGISVVPTMMLVSSEGKELQRWEGAVSEATLRPWLANPEE